MTTPNYSLRLQASLKAAAERLAKQEGTTLNQFINVAVAEKVAAIDTAAFFAGRGGRGDPALALGLLDAMGGSPLRDGDELPG